METSKLSHGIIVWIALGPRLWALTLQCLRSILRVGGRSQWKSSSSRERLSGLCRGSGRLFIQEITKGSQPNWDGSMKIIPHRLTVAGCRGRKQPHKAKKKNLFRASGYLLPIKLDTMVTSYQACWWINKVSFKQNGYHSTNELLNIG